jgi:hypothetical protein
MGYLIKAPLGLALFIGGIVLFNVKLVSLLGTGTCASGNTPYQIAQPCPSGTGTDILLLMAGIFGGLIGAGLFVWRGDPPLGQESADQSQQRLQLRHVRLGSVLHRHRSDVADRLAHG